ncbi:uncharacterized protein LOC136091024 [Hydra vulgaris]|uniref:Uncharacterized protein LOC136091024 n=1 Tax=Hydra vulgaris TaxID=6087 RepID=A0ABM4DHW9_HYDVU
MAKNFTPAQKEILESHEITMMKIFNDRIEKMEIKFYNLKDENLTIKKKSKKSPDISNIENGNNNIEEKIAELEDRSRRNNLRIVGIEDRAHRVGKETGKNSSIVVRFQNYKDKALVLNKLTTMKLWNERLYVNEDFSDFTINLRRKFFKEAKELRAKDETENIFNIISLTETWISSNEFKNNSIFHLPGNNLANKIPITEKTFSDFLEPINNSLFIDNLYSDLSFDEFERAYKSLERNKATGADEINGNIVIDCFENLKCILYKVFRASIQQGVFLDQLKTAKVTPIYKDGKKSNISNYRPISVLSTFSKILERIIYNRTYNYLNLNKLLYKNQFGFKKNCSTEQPITQFIREISNSFGRSQYTLGIFIDQPKAFDTVDHKILLKKLKFYGINGN